MLVAIFRFRLALALTVLVALHPWWLVAASRSRLLTAALAAPCLLLRALRPLVPAVTCRFPAASRLLVPAALCACLRARVLVVPAARCLCLLALRLPRLVLAVQCACLVAAVAAAAMFRSSPALAAALLAAR